MCGGSAPNIGSLSPENCSESLEKHFGGRAPAQRWAQGEARINPTETHRLLGTRMISRCVEAMAIR